MKYSTVGQTAPIAMKPEKFMDIRRLGADAVRSALPDFLGPSWPACACVVALAANINASPAKTRNSIKAVLRTAAFWSPGSFAFMEVTSR